MTLVLLKTKTCFISTLKAFHSVKQEAILMDLLEIKFSMNWGTGKYFVCLLCASKLLLPDMFVGLQIAPFSILPISGTLISNKTPPPLCEINVALLFILISLANNMFTDTEVLPYRTWGRIRIPCHYRSYYCPQLNIFMHLKKVRRPAENRRFIYIFYRDFHNSCVFERPKVIETGIHMGIFSFYFQSIKSSCLVVQWLKMKIVINFIKLDLHIDRYWPMYRMKTEEGSSLIRSCPTLWKYQHKSVFSPPQESPCLIRDYHCFYMKYLFLNIISAWMIKKIFSAN